MFFFVNPISLYILCLYVSIRSLIGYKYFLRLSNADFDSISQIIVSYINSNKYVKVDLSSFGILKMNVNNVSTTCNTNSGSYEAQIGFNLEISWEANWKMSKMSRNLKSHSYFLALRSNINIRLCEMWRLCD